MRVLSHALVKFKHFRFVLYSAYFVGLVPIVRGQFPRYEKHAPPGSYIHADTFFSYEDLAKYLKYLIDHPAEYNKYFEWRK